VKQATRAVAELGTPAQARAAWRRILALLPGDYGAAEMAARALKAGGDPQGSEEAWAQARRLDPEAAAQARTGEQPGASGI
jgi:hypothetical protein